LTKMGLMGVQLRIALRNELPQEFEIIDTQGDKEEQSKSETDTTIEPDVLSTDKISNSSTEQQQEKALAAGGSTNG
jgi:small subunit ribosomal protein S3